MSVTTTPAPVGRLAAAGPYREALQCTLATVPYNSATEFHRAFGHEPVDPRFGAVCIRQTLQAGEVAVGLGAPEPLLLQDGRHVAAVFVDGGDVIVLDPYLLHLEPVVFPAHEVAAGASAVIVDAAPARVGADGASKPGRLEARYSARADGTFVIRLSYSRYSLRLSRYVLARHFSLRSDRTFDQEAFAADVARQLTHPEQTSMSVRAFDPVQQGTIEAILPLAGFAHRTFARDDLWLRGPDGVAAPEASAATQWGRLAALLGLSADQVADHLLEAGRIYQRIADPAIPVAAYPLDAE